MNNRERAESIKQLSVLALRLLAAQKFGECVQTLQLISEHAADIAKDLHK